MKQLPIDVVPGNVPPLFRWHQDAGSPLGQHTVPCEGRLPPGVEDAVVRLIAQVKALQVENARLTEELNKSQEYYLKGAEKTEPVKVVEKSVSSKKGRQG